MTMGLLGQAQPLRGQDALETEREGMAPYSNLYNGSFVGVGAWTGPASLGNDAFSDSFGWGGGLTAEFSVPLQLLDLQLTYFHSSLSGTYREQEVSMTSNSIGGSINLHPLFATILFADTLGYALGSIYVQFGIAAEGTTSTFAGEPLDDGWQLTTHAGAGFDVPIGNANDGSAPWLGFYYRYNNVPSDLPGLDPDEPEITQHFFTLRFGYRINGLIF